MFSFMELLEERSIDRITVKDICETCEINRNTFYYYRDIYDVLTEVFVVEREKVLKDLGEDASFYEEYRKCAGVFLNNKKAIIHIYKSKSTIIKNREWENEI